MKLLEDIFKKIILNESVSEEEVNDALDNHKRVIIKYNGPVYKKGKTENEVKHKNDPRVIEVYAYGQTSLGNKVIRAFEPYGGTQSEVPEWKYFLLDRITDWQPTNQIFTKPADFYYKNLGKFNPTDDKTMAIVFKIAKFGNENTMATPQTDKPKTNQDVFKTDTENRMERFKQQTDNQINLSDIKTNDAFKQLPTKPIPNNKPKTNQDVYKTTTNTEPSNQNEPKTPEERQNELDKLRRILGDKPISLADLNKKMKEEPQTRWQDIFNADVEKDMEQMRKNDLTNMRRRDNRWQKSADTRPLNRKGSLNREI